MLKKDFREDEDFELVGAGFEEKNWAIQWAVLYEKRWKSGMRYMRTFRICNDLWAFHYGSSCWVYGHKWLKKLSGFCCCFCGGLSPPLGSPTVLLQPLSQVFDSFKVSIFPCLHFFISCFHVQNFHLLLEKPFYAFY